MALQTINIEQVNAYPLITLTPTFRTTDALKSSQAFSDEGGNLHELTTFLRGNDTVSLYRRLDRAGRQLNAFRLDAPDPIKVDGLTMYDSGASVRFRGWAHDYHPISPRDSWPVDAEIPNMVVPRANGQPFVPGPGGAGAFVFPAQNLQEAGVSEQVIRQIVQDQANRIIEAGVTDAELAGALGPLADQGEIERAFSAGGPFPIFAQQINTSFSAQLIVEYLMGRWDGKLPDGSVWRHPLTGMPITDETPWVKGSKK